ncbi:hypothetical protein SCA6_012774 [Theobroma cacao]
MVAIAGPKLQEKVLVFLSCLGTWILETPAGKKSVLDKRIFDRQRIANLWNVTTRYCHANGLL